MELPAVSSPARARRPRVPWLAAAPWALVAIVACWVFGYTSKREVVCPKCYATVADRESGLNLGRDRVIPLGRARTVTTDTALAGIVDQDCDHRTDEVSVVTRRTSRSDSPAQIARRWAHGTNRALGGAPGIWYRDLLLDVIGSPTLWDYSTLGTVEWRRPFPVPSSWAGALHFKLQSQPALRAAVRAAVDSGEVSVEDVRAILQQRRQPTSAPLTAYQQRLRDIAVRFATDEAAYSEPRAPR